MKRFYNLWPRFLMAKFRPGEECVNIPSYVVTFPATTARKTFFGAPTDPTQPSLFRYEPRHEKTNVVVFYLVKNKPGCTATEDSLRLKISDLESGGILLSM